MVKHCAVFGCSTNGNLKTGITMFQFPNEKHTSTRRSWINFVKTTRKNFSVPTSYNGICALHFTADSFEDQYTHELKAMVGLRQRKLKKDAVPTLLTEKCEAALQRSWTTVKPAASCHRPSNTESTDTVTVSSPRGKRRLVRDVRKVNKRVAI